MNYHKGFIAPLLLVIIALLLAGGAYIYMQDKQPTVVTAPVTIDSVSAFSGPDGWTVVLKGSGFSKSSTISIKRNDYVQTILPSSVSSDGTQIYFSPPVDFDELNRNAINNWDAANNMNAASIYSVQILDNTSASNIVPIPNPYAGRG